MAEISLRHELDCDEDTFWNKCTFDDAFTRTLFIDKLKFPGFEVLESTEDDSKRTRKLRISPPVTGLPGPLKKIFGDAFSYVEEGVFDKATRRYKFKVTPSTMPDKAKTTGELYCEKLGDKKIARVARVHVEVKVFAIGGMIEDKIAQDLRASYEAAARFINEWAKANP